MTASGQPDSRATARAMFADQVSLLTFGRMAGGAAAFGLNAVLVRLLGPGRFGTLAASLAVIAVLLRVFSLGLGPSAQFAGASSRLGSQGSGALLVAAAPPIVLAILSVALFGEQLERLVPATGDTAGWLSGPIRWAIPLGLVHFIASLYELGRRDLRQYVGMTTIPSILALIAGAIGLMLDMPGVRWAMVAVLSQQVVAASWALRSFVRGFALPNATGVLAVYRYAGRSFLSSLGAFASGRALLLSGAWFTSSEALGIFAVARLVTDSTLFLYGAIGPLLFSQVASDRTVEASRTFTEAVVRVSILAFATVTVLVALIAPLAVPLVFGPAFGEAWVAVGLLVGGVIASSVQRLLENYLYGRERHAPMAAVHIAGMLVAIGAGAALAPRWGANGLALATTFGFVVSFAITALLARRDGINLRHSLLPGRADLQRLNTLVTRILKRGRDSPSNW